MSTSDPPVVPPGEHVAAAQLTKEIERLANELFQAPPGPLPNAMNVGAGGISPAGALPTPPSPAPSVDPFGGPLALDLPTSSAIASPVFAPSPAAVGASPFSQERPIGHALPPDPILNPRITPPPGGGLSSPSVPSEATHGEVTRIPGERDASMGDAPYFLPGGGPPGLGVPSTNPIAHAITPDQVFNPKSTAPPGGGLSSPSAPSDITHVPSVPNEVTHVPGERDAAIGDTPYFLTIARGVQTPALTEPATKPQSATPAVDASPATGTSYDFHPEIVPHVSTPDVGVYDAHAVKRDFPILHQNVNGRPLVWLDNAATTHKPNAVIERIEKYYRHENSNVHRAAHTLAARSTDAYEGSRKTVQRFLNAGTPDEIVFVRGATEGINLIAKSWGARNIEEGDEILITWLEHHANIVPWQQLCSAKRARLRVAPVDSHGQVILEEYEKLLNQRTKLVAFTQVSNALGTITPAKEMIEMAHRWGALVALDGAQAVSHMAVDVQALDCDFYSFSGHKIFAPMGIGAVYGKKNILSAMPPWQGGGNMIQDVTFEKTTYQAPPWRFEAGTGSIADAVGLGAALDYVSMLGLPRIAAHEHELRVYAEGCLSQIRGLRIIGTAPDKAGVISFVLDGQKTEEVGGLLDLEGIAVRSGHHCAQPILRRFGVESTVRASLAPYNTREDVDALVAAVRRLQEGRPGSYETPRERNFESKQIVKN